MKAIYVSTCLTFLFFFSCKPSEYITNGGGSVASNSFNAGSIESITLLSHHFQQPGNERRSAARVDKLEESLNNPVIDLFNSENIDFIVPEDEVYEDQDSLKKEFEEIVDYYSKIKTVASGKIDMNIEADLRNAKKHITSDYGLYLSFKGITESCNKNKFKVITNPGIAEPDPECFNGDDYESNFDILIFDLTNNTLVWTYTYSNTIDPDKVILENQFKSMLMKLKYNLNIKPESFEFKIPPGFVDIVKNDGTKMRGSIMSHKNLYITFNPEETNKTQSDIHVSEIKSIKQVKYFKSFFPKKYDDIVIEQ